MSGISKTCIVAIFYISAQVRWPYRHFQCSIYFLRPIEDWPKTDLIRFHGDNIKNYKFPRRRGERARAWRGWLIRDPPCPSNVTHPFLIHTWSALLSSRTQHPRRWCPVRVQLLRGNTARVVAEVLRDTGVKNYFHTEAPFFNHAKSKSLWLF